MLSSGAAGSVPPPGGLPATTTVAGMQRCLDASHGADCTRCKEAPARSDENLWILLGEAGAKNGEKRLRRLLTRCAEWGNPEERRSTAAFLDSDPVMAPVASVLRGEANVGELRKTHMIGLARTWRYKSDIWVLKSQKRSVEVPASAPELPSRRAKRAVYGVYADVAEGKALGTTGGAHPTGSGGAPSRGGGAMHSAGLATGVAPSAASSFLPRGASMEDTLAYIKGQFVPMAPIYHGLVAGTALQPSLAETGVPFLDRRVLPELQRARANYETVRRALSAAADESRAAAAALQSRAGGDAPGRARDAAGPSPDSRLAAPAWRLLAGRRIPLEVLLEQLIAQSGAASAAHRMRQDAASATFAGPLALPRGAAAWLADMRRVYLTTLHMLSEALWLVKHLAMGRADICLIACAELADALASVAAAAAAGMMHRIAWVDDLMSSSPRTDEEDEDEAAHRPVGPPFFEAVHLHLTVIPHPDLNLEA